MELVNAEVFVNCIACRMDVSPGWVWDVCEQLDVIFGRNGCYYAFPADEAEVVEAIEKEL